MSMFKRRYNQVVILEENNGEFHRIKEEESVKEQNIRNGLPLADYYGKAKSSTEMCNSQYLPVKKIKKERINIKALLRIHKHNASFFHLQMDTTSPVRSCFTSHLALQNTKCLIQATC